MEEHRIRSEQPSTGELTAMSSTEWRARSVSMNAYVTVNLGQLADSWKHHVTRFVAEFDSPRGDRTTWGVHDYTAALYIRDAIQSALAELSPEERALVVQAIDSADRDLRALVELDSTERLLMAASSKPDVVSWWWTHIPVRGPVRRDLGGG